MCAICVNIILLLMVYIMGHLVSVKISSEFFAVFVSLTKITFNFSWQNDSTLYLQDSIW